jgi:hypothetical protein
LPLLGELKLMKQVEERLQTVAEKLRPDILHAHSPVLNALPTLRVGKRLGIPVVYEVRAFWEDAAVDHGSTTEGSARYRFTRWLETRALRDANHVFTICEGLRSDIVARGIPSSKVTVIPECRRCRFVRYTRRAGHRTQGRAGADRQDRAGFHRLFLCL